MRQTQETVTRGFGIENPQFVNMRDATTRTPVKNARFAAVVWRATSSAINATALQANSAIALLACNAVAFIALLVARQTTAANLAFLTGVLVVASLMFTNWGFSMPNPRVTVSWVCLIPALIAQLALIACPFWLPLTQRIGG